MGNRNSSSTRDANKPGGPGTSTAKPKAEEPAREEVACKTSVDFSDIEASLKTADLVLLYKPNQSLPNYATFINYKEIDPYFPHLLMKGKSSPLEMTDFNPGQREVHIHTAVTRIFYGDYEKVAIRKLICDQKISSDDAMRVAEAIKNIPFSEKEKAAVSNAKSAEERMAIVSTYVIAHFYKQLGLLVEDPADILPETLEKALPLEEAVFISLPPVKYGAMATGKPPLLSRLV